MCKPIPFIVGSPAYGDRGAKLAMRLCSVVRWQARPSCGRNGVTNLKGEIVMAITTIHQLAIATGKKKRTLSSRAVNYPIPEKHKMIYKGRKVYRIGVLENWHKVTENIINGRSHDIQIDINEGEQARLAGASLDSNPHNYATSLGRFCSWAAGWQDAKKS